MASDKRSSGSEDDWLFDFAHDDDHVVPTEKLPSPEDFARVRAEQARLDAERVAPSPHRPERPAPARVPFVDSEGPLDDPERPATDGIPVVGDPAAAVDDSTATGEIPAATGEIPATGDTAATGEIPVLDSPTGAQPPLAPTGAEPSPAPAAAHPASYARSGSTPNQPPRQEIRTALPLPEAFAEMSGWDAVREGISIAAYIAVFSTVITWTGIAWLDVIARITAGIGLAGIIAAYVLRWRAAPPMDRSLRLVRRVRLLTQIPAGLAALAVIITDLVLSLPVLFAKLPEGPPVGVGAGVALLTLGAVLGREPRRHEGFAPGDVEKSRSRTRLSLVRSATLASAVIAAVMMAGKAFAGDPLFSLVTLSRSLASFAIIMLFVEAALRRRPSWYVFLMGAAAALVLGAMLDASLQFTYAAPQSFATGFVWLPFMFAAFGIASSRSYVRSMPLSFRRVDWLVYSHRTFEYSAAMHAVGLLSAAMVALAILFGYPAQYGMGIASTNVVLMVVLFALSLAGRSALRSRDPQKARSTSILMAVLISSIGFLGVIINTVAYASGANLTDGGLGLVAGLAAALMLAVPAPIRNEYGAPDVALMFREFRFRDVSGTGLFSRVPNMSAETSQRKAFPAASESRASGAGHPRADTRASGAGHSPADAPGPVSPHPAKD